MRKFLFTLGLILVFGLSVDAQSSYTSSYTFTSSSTTYTPITGGTVHDTGYYIDDYRFLRTLPFTFVMDGVSYTKIIINDNGYICFGDTDPGNYNHGPISSSASSGTASPFGVDLYSNSY